MSQFGMAAEELHGHIDRLVRYDRRGRACSISIERLVIEDVYDGHHVAHACPVGRVEVPIRTVLVKLIAVLKVC